MIRPGRHLPNLLSLLRIGLAGALLPVALLHHRVLVLAVLAAGFLTDAADGFLARRLIAVTDLGRRLDSLGDYVLMLTLLPGMFVLWPGFIQREAVWLALGVGAYFAPTIWSLLRWRIMPALHTWGSKVLAVAVSVALPVALLNGPVMPLRLVCALQLLVAAEEVAILGRMPGHSGHVPTIWHTRRP
jgi:CDP-diacylglycerol--glycerol-3-phosphate 3-phosphatidyltransferase